ncbi:hypothetical protein D3C85_1319150 [compost metagenome]
MPSSRASPVVIGTSCPTRMVASSLSSVISDGVCSRLEPSSDLAALMMKPNRPSEPMRPPPPPTKPLAPSRLFRARF